MTSIEWLIEQLRQLAHNDKHHLGMGDIRITQGMLDDFYEQAKEMHKQEIIDAYKNYQSYLIEEFLIKEQAHKGITMHKPFEGNSKTFEQWVETYGSKGSDERIVDTNKTIISQTEISDEEIELLAWENPCLSRQDVYELFDEVFKDKTLSGMFKISASKEVRQFKERLRQLAKQKYREQLKKQL